MDKLIIIACFTGFIGDFLLQTGIKNGLGETTGWGLRDYFKQHGETEAYFIAGGMMSLFYGIFILLKISLTNLSPN